MHCYSFSFQFTCLITTVLSDQWEFLLLGQPYAGVESGDQCYCGYIQPMAHRLVESENDCNMLCAGDERQICGGHWRISIFKVKG